MRNIIYAECCLCWVSQTNPLCWVSLCWMSLCWVSKPRFTAWRLLSAMLVSFLLSLCWKSWRHEGNAECRNSAITPNVVLPSVAEPKSSHQNPSISWKNRKLVFHWVILFEGWLSRVMAYCKILAKALEIFVPITFQSGKESFWQKNVFVEFVWSLGWYLKTFLRSNS